MTDGFTIVFPLSGKYSGGTYISRTTTISCNRTFYVRTHPAHLTLTSVGILARTQCYTCRILAKNEVNETTIYGSPFCPADIEMERNEARKEGREEDLAGK